MAALKTLVRLFSYLFHLVLTLFLLAVAVLAMASPMVSLRLDMLPWTGATLARWLLFGAPFGLASVLLAMAGKLRWLFWIWALAVLVFLLRGYIFNYYRFTPAGAELAALLLAGSLVAFVGACFQRSRRPA